MTLLSFSKRLSEDKDTVNTLTGNRRREAMADQYHPFGRESLKWLDQPPWIGIETGNHETAVLTRNPGPPEPLLPSVVKARFVSAFWAYNFL